MKKNKYIFSLILANVIILRLVHNLKILQKKKNDGYSYY